MDKRISCIVICHKRFIFVDLIVRSLLGQNTGILGEILLVCSRGSSALQSLADLYSNDSAIPIRYIEAENVISAKRNAGIKASVCEFLLFLDDDCVPRAGFLKAHFQACIARSQSINNGLVSFDESERSKSNYVRYRQLRHFAVSGGSGECLKYWNITTMNMSCRKSDLLRFNLTFEERFKKYGMEDVYFGYKADRFEFKLCLVQAEICHLDFEGLNSHLNKIYLNSRYGVALYRELVGCDFWALPTYHHFECSSSSLGFWTRLRSKLIRCLLIKPIAALVVEFLILTDHVRWLYSPLLFRYVIAFAHLRGVKDRSVNLFEPN